MLECSLFHLPFCFSYSSLLFVFPLGSLLLFFSFVPSLFCSLSSPLYFTCKSSRWKHSLTATNPSQWARLYSNFLTSEGSSDCEDWQCGDLTRAAMMTTLRGASLMKLLSTGITTHVDLMRVCERARGSYSNPIKIDTTCREFLVLSRWFQHVHWYSRS